MEDSITIIAVECVEEILQKIKESDFSSLGELSGELLGTLKGITSRLLVTVLASMDEALVTEAKKQRKLEGMTVKERKVKRTVLTALGEITYERTYFTQRDGRKVYLLDYIIGVESHERIAKELCAEILNKVADMSMEKAAKATGETVSRQTVDNKLLSMINPVTEIKREENTPEEIHIFADEDHVHLRPKKSGMVPLITVTEGIDATNEKRHKTIAPVSFQGYGMNTECFAEDVTAAIYERYDMEKVNKTVIHADGGSWIRGIGELMPNPVYVMDGFHLKKYMKKLLSLPGAAPYTAVIKKSITENNREAFMEYVRRIKEKQEERELKKYTEIVTYFQNNWDSIVARMSGEYCGSCTEPLVSHILSERLSRNPLAWSEEGLAKMAMLRVYTANGGKITAENIRVSRSKEERIDDHNALKNGLEIYRQYADKQIKTVLDGNYDWSIFEKEKYSAGLSYGKLTGTTVLLKAFSKLKASFVA